MSVLSYQISKAKISLYYLSSSENGYIPLILTKESNAACREIILLFCFSCSKIKDTVPYPISSLQNSMHTLRKHKRKKQCYTSLVISNKCPSNLNISGHVWNVDSFCYITLHTRDKNCHNTSHHFILHPFTTKVLKEYKVCQLKKLQKALPLESTFTANISVFSGIQSFLGVLWKQSGTFGVPPVLTTYMTQKETCAQTLERNQAIRPHTHPLKDPSTPTCSSSILSSLQSWRREEGSASEPELLWQFVLLDVPGNFTAT